MHFKPGRSGRLVVSLSGVGPHRYRPPAPEFAVSASDGGENHVLFISDLSRSWMNGPGVAAQIVQLIEDCRSRHDISQVVALGDSMGGFAAIRLAELIEIDTVIALSPQFSADPRLVPEETRWLFHRQKIDRWSHRHVGGLDRPGTSYFLFHGGAPEEARHWQRFPWNRRLNHFILTGAGHNVARTLKKRCLLQPVVQAAIAQKPRRVRKLLERELFGRNLAVTRREVLQPDLCRATPLPTPRPRDDGARALPGHRHGEAIIGPRAHRTGAVASSAG